MEKITNYLFDSMFQSKRAISQAEKLLVVTGAFIFVLSTSILLAISV